MAQKIKSRKKQEWAAQTLLNSSWHFVKKYWKFFLVLFLFFKCGFDFYEGYLMRKWLKEKPKAEKMAIVIEEKYYWGNSPVSNFNTYKYEFLIGDIKFQGVCPNNNYKPGDSIKVLYVIEKPTFNKAKE